MYGAHICALGAIWNRYRTRRDWKFQPRSAELCVTNNCNSWSK